ncbi:MAG: hypothetical protein H0U71_06215 [Gammaproteobacteria bacterium]|nr:hypothetical protein [Gammaproteobacteria bacterium]
MSRTAGLTFKNRNVISFTIILPMTLYILNQMAFSLDIDITSCFENDYALGSCLDDKRAEQIRINQHYLAIVGAVAGYYVPAAINSSYDILKGLSNKIS